mmetsp:Transcript_25295/g.59382  ORF Transcript_25295/g.59382 Transcript_25295/m.59382 type:complete len:277 (-) Transcript_25295:296-1126(-)
MKPLHTSFQLPLEAVDGLALERLQLSFRHSPDQTFHLVHDEAKDSRLGGQSLELLLRLAQGIADVLAQAVLGRLEHVFLLLDVTVHLRDAIFQDLSELCAQYLLAPAVLFQASSKLLRLLGGEGEPGRQACLALSGFVSAHRHTGLELRSELLEGCLRVLSRGILPGLGLCHHTFRGLAHVEAHLCDALRHFGGGGPKAVDAGCKALEGIFLPSVEGPRFLDIDQEPSSCLGQVVAVAANLTKLFAQFSLLGTEGLHLRVTLAGALFEELLELPGS